MRIMDDDPDVKIQVEGHRCMYIHMYVHTQYRIQSVHIHGNTLSNTHTQTHIHTYTHTHTHTHYGSDGNESPGLALQRAQAVYKF